MILHTGALLNYVLNMDILSTPDLHADSKAIREKEQLSVSCKMTGFPFVGYPNVIATHFASRLGLITLATVLFVFSYSPFCLPVYIWAYTPLVHLWRTIEKNSSYCVVICEAIIAGCLMSWPITRFIDSVVPVNSFPLHLAGSLLFSLQLVGFALVAKRTSKLSTWRAAPIIALTAVLLEVVQASIGLVWAPTQPLLAIADTPIAQWSGILGPFCLSFLLFLISVLWLPNIDNTFLGRFRTIGVASFLCSVLWIGGWAIESSVIVKPPPFAAMLVQPQIDGHNVNWGLIDELTTESVGNDGPVGLVVWPESILAPTPYKDLAKAQTGECSLDLQEDQKQLLNFQQLWLPKYKSACLVGGLLYDRLVTDMYGLPVYERRYFNCGFLFDDLVGVQCHKKLALVPFWEGLPDWMPRGVMKAYVFPWFNIEGSIIAGQEYSALTFIDEESTAQTIAVSICYESWLPWLPQYHQTQDVAVNCHIMSDLRLKNFPEMTQRHLQAVRMRAIETRKWQLVCSTYSGTAVIDPRGRIVKQLLPGPGFLRTDQLE